MSDSSTNRDPDSEPWAAFQKMWTETCTRMMQAGFSHGPETAPPEFLRHIRAGIFQALSQSWDEFLRSPQFMEGTKQWMEQALAFRKMTNDFLTKARHETQTTAREDIDTVMLAMRHMETRILDRVDEMADQVHAMGRRIDEMAGIKPAAPGPTNSPRKQSSRRRRR